MEKRPTYKQLERLLKEASEKVKKTEELKNSFLANMSHEIRTPMNAIVGASELLRDDSLSKEERNEFTKILSSSSKELLDLFNRILELSQLESGALEYTESEVDTHTLLIKLYTIFEQKVGASQKYINLKFTEDLPDIKIFTDSAKLLKLLSYLLDNAVKFTEKGDIDYGFAIQDRYTLLFYVKDTGPGISKAQQETIFKKFTQVDNSYTRIHSGAGLGLCLCKELATVLGGNLHIDSEIGQGSIFYFTIPLKLSETNVILTEKLEIILKNNINNIYSSSNSDENIAI